MEEEERTKLLVYPNFIYYMHTDRVVSIGREVTDAKFSVCCPTVHDSIFFSKCTVFFFLFSLKLDNPFILSKVVATNATD